jgi:[acyl-carrier-protein] S-malonyltransferase
MESELPNQPEFSRDELRAALVNTALAFRGYNVTNLGRTAELLAHPRYGPIMRAHLNEASAICTAATQRPADLVRRVEQGRETELNDYAEAIALIIAVEQAQLMMLEQCHQIEGHTARMSFGFSLGEIGALVFGGVVSMADALKILLAMADDCVALAHDVTLGILFSRDESIPFDRVWLLCQQLTLAGEGVIGISAQLAPNSLLVMGTGDTIDRLKLVVKEQFPRGVHLKKNEHRWPPLHTPIVWGRNIPNRSAVMLQRMQGGFSVPRPPVFSLATGQFSYDGVRNRAVLSQWVDHSQRLWEAVYETMALGIDLVLHVGPAPNIVPATISRLAANVETQTRQNPGIRALSMAVRRTWLPRILPKRTALLRAPFVRQLVLEDWLLAHAPAD